MNPSGNDVVFASTPIKWNPKDAFTLNESQIESNTVLWVYRKMIVLIILSGGNNQRKIRFCLM